MNQCLKCFPCVQGFDSLLEAMKCCLAEDSLSAFVFNCGNGKGRTTTAMVIATLTLWHFNVRLHSELCCRRECVVGIHVLKYFCAHCIKNRIVELAYIIQMFPIQNTKL